MAKRLVGTIKGLPGDKGDQGIQGIPGDVTPEYIALADQVSEDAVEADTSEQAAIAASVQAGQYRDQAQTAKTGAESARDTATAASNAAQTSASSASGFASNAASSASASTNSASAASNSAAAASGSALSAANAASAAGNSATNALASANSATSSALAANNALNGAQTAQNAAQNAQTAAETAANVALTGQFAGNDLGTTDLNTIYTAGVYRQAATANGTLARNYPLDLTSGTLVVYTRNNVTTTAGRVVQVYYAQLGANATDARVYYQRASNSGGWTTWRVYRSTRIDNPANQPGYATYLWNEGTASEIQLQATMINLGTTDLNVVTYPGVYLQPSTSQANTALNYPMNSVTGVLEVSSSSSVLNVLIQRFTVSGGSWGPVSGIHTRRLTGGTWGAWTFIPKHRVDNTAGRAMYVFDDSANREQLFYGDTGWRSVNTALLNGWTMASYRIRRVGSMVSFVIGSLNGAAANATQFETLAAGFRPYSTEGFTLFFEGNSPTSVYRTYVSSGGQMTTGTPIPAVNIGGTMNWMTSDAWPTALPGTALGSVPNT